MLSRKIGLRVILARVPGPRQVFIVTHPVVLLATATLWFHSITAHFLLSAKPI